MHKSRVGLIFTMLAFFLSGCGGGGGGGGATGETVESFPVRNAFSNYIGNPRTIDVDVSGTCSGTGTLSDSSLSSATFEGQSALRKTSTITLSLIDCSPSSLAATTELYVDSDRNLLGHSIPGEEYGVFLTPPIPVPVSARRGDNGAYGTETLYTDSSKQTTIGRYEFSYVIENDGNSPSTAILNFISREFNTANELLATEQDRYRIDKNGALTFVSTDIQFSTTSDVRFILTPR